MGNVVNPHEHVVGWLHRGAELTRPGKGSARTGMRLHNWAFDDPSVFERVYGNLIEETGAVMMGRRSYDNSIEEWGGKGPMGDAVPFIVITHRPLPEPDPVFTVTDGLEPALAKAREVAGDKRMGSMGANIDQQYLADGLVDEMGITNLRPARRRPPAVRRPPEADRAGADRGQPNRRRDAPGLPRPHVVPDTTTPRCWWNAREVRGRMVRMWFVPAVVLVAIAIGYLFGGRLRNFERLSVHWWSFAFLGLVLQAVTIPRYWDLAPKRGRGGVAPVLRAPVGVPHGEPVDPRRAGDGDRAAAERARGRAERRDAGQRVGDRAGRRQRRGLEATGSTKHHVATDDDLLPFLGDAIPIPEPVGIALSIGDVLLYGGMAWFGTRSCGDGVRRTPGRCRCGSCRIEGNMPPATGGCRRGIASIGLKQRRREPYRDPRALAGRAHDLDDPPPTFARSRIIAIPN